MDYHITDQMLNDAIGAMPVTFDSHAIIEALMTARPREYVHDLYEHYLTAQDDPIKELHAAIGRRLAGRDFLIFRCRVHGSPIARPKAETIAYARKGDNRHVPLLGRFPENSPGIQLFHHLFNRLENFSVFVSHGSPSCVYAL